MINMRSPFSSAVFNSMFTISIPNKAAVSRLANINGHGRRRTLTHCTPPVLSDMVVDVTSFKVVRPITTNFTPNMWGDVFSIFILDDQVQQKYADEIEALKKEVGSILMAATSAKLMNLIDKLERLAVAHHFEKEIEDKLKQVYEEHGDKDDDYDLFTTALRFRLLRQHQYHVSCNAFAKFVEKDNEMKESLSGDVEGLLSLYEAAHVRILDEKLLEEAVAFTTHHLTRLLPQLESQPLLKQEVQLALTLPLHKRLSILTLRSYIDFYENDDSKEETVLRLAKFNFNFMQNIFREELFQLTTWWNKFDLKSKVPYTRDRLVECYIWSLSHGFQPHYSLIRTMLTKFYIMITTMDDAYDNYATLEEIELLTRAIERWSMDEAHVLPDNLKEVYKFIINFGDEFESEAEKQEKFYIVPYFIEEMKQLARRYAEEQKWILEKEMPSFEERMMNSRVTTLMYVSLLPTIALIKSCTKETVEWVLSEADIFIISSDLIRLLDDLTTHQRESRDGVMVTPLNYYMKDRGTSMQEAKSDYQDLIDDKWKHLTSAWVDCTMIPKEIAVQFMELARQCETIFIDREDGFTWPENTRMAPLIAALMFDPIVI